MRRGKSCAALFLLGLTGLAFAQTDPCEATYAGSVREVRDSQFEASQAQAIYNEDCEANGSVRSSAVGVNLSATIKKIPVSLGVNTSNDEQTLAQFCKIYKSSSLATEASSSFSNTVVTKALALFNQCEYILKTNKVAITHSTQGLDSLVIQVSFNPQEANVSLRGVVYDPAAAECKLAGVRPGSAPIVVDSRFKTTQMQGNFSVRCVRKYSVQNGSRRYSPLNVGVDTSQGTYNVELQNESVYPFDVASRNKALYDALQSKAAALTRDRDALAAGLQAATTRLMAPNVELHSAIQQQDGQIACEQDGGRREVFAQEVCQSKKVVGMYVAFEEPHKKCGRKIWVFGCLAP